MTLTNVPPGSGLFVLLALFLTVATVWLLLRAIEALPNEINAQSFLVLIIVIVPFVMGIYFGLATIICNEIVAQPNLPLELSLRKIVPATVR
jgi:bacteriorhodopsin